MDRLAPTINLLASGANYAQVEGDNNGNTITVHRESLNSNTVVVREGTTKVSFSNTAGYFTVDVFGRDGNDDIQVVETNGSFDGYTPPGTNMYVPPITTRFPGEGGDDTLVGGSSKDFLAGRPGNDSNDGGAGYDSIHEELYQESKSAASSIVLTNSQIAVTVGTVTKIAPASNFEGVYL